MSSDDRYIALLKDVLANRHAAGVGPRMRYLLDCIDPALVRETRLQRSPRDEDGRITFDVGYFRDLEQREPEAVVGVREEPGGHYWWEHTLGFPFTMVSPERLDNVEFAVRTVIDDGIPGDVLESGVWRGGVAILVQALLTSLGEPHRQLWLADSFEGLPPPSHDQDRGLALDLNWMLPASAAEVRANFEAFGLLADNVRFLEGYFEDTMPAAPVEQLSVLRLDGDYYSSTIEVLEPMYDFVSPGGFVIVDDYGYHEGCRNAVHDFLDSRALAPEIVRIDDHGVYWRA